MAVEIHVQQQGVQITRAAAAATALDPLAADFQPVRLFFIVIRIADIGCLPHFACRGFIQVQGAAISRSGNQG
ncbi:hypothetical protein [Janthinobacterium violaceinigrum]|uniref:Uncharacterized protein n=1 Tax=Janthinobacterium violaceinigrum TaxID=2654252 RepID=A0A6I1IEF6_9BURK|nr:hypothetical protein [Janthinobacterium violaceinigrum]KAB8065747.1 hypothetical protein GCN75_05745 [Janthinobacterium violaceinigrum]